MLLNPSFLLHSQQKNELHDLQCFQLEPEFLHLGQVAMMQYSHLMLH